MTSREKIIVGIMCLTVIYGAYEVIGGRKSKRTETEPPKNNSEELRTFVTDISQKLTGERLTDGHRYLIGQAVQEWRKDPFISSSAGLRSKISPGSAERIPVQVPQKAELAYTGFLDLAGNRMAFINGLEYSVGEPLEVKGLYVKLISPKHVVIGKSDSQETIELNLQETDFEPTEKAR
jgi:hypothetical protein